MKEIKCFIFDQDGTFYPEKSDITDILREKTKKWIMDRLSLDKKEVDDLYKKLPKKYPNALEGFQCERCGHKWVPRGSDEEPSVCPKCKSPYWNKPRKRKVKKK